MSALSAQTSLHGDKVDDDRDSSGWSASAYNVGASFVYSAAATAPVLSLLDARPGEKILDFGCGSGEITKELKKLVGDEGVVVGVDISESMITKALEVTGFERSHLLVADLQMPFFPDGTQPEFAMELVGGKFDKVFSTATLHWCSQDPKQALVNAHRMLRSGGRIVGEMGGYGNVEGVRAALHKVLAQRGINPTERDPWFFPSVDTYTQIIASAGFNPVHVSLNARPTPVADLKNWLRSFCMHNFLRSMSSDEAERVMTEVEEVARQDERCWDVKAEAWCLDYVRLRFVADKD